MGLAALGLTAIDGRSTTAATAGTFASQRSLAARPAQFAARAERVIHIFFNGGASHVDTFDPKPELTRRHGRPLPSPNLITERQTGVAMASPFRFDHYGQSGIEVSELFSHLGEQIDDVCVIRSMVADLPNHEPSLMLMNTGTANVVRPSFGSWVTYGLGAANENLPAFVAMSPGGHPVKGPQNWQAAFLPSVFQGTYIDTKETDHVEKLIANIRNPRMPAKTQRQQLDFVQRLNRVHLQRRRQDPQLEARIQSYEQAYRMQAAATDAFDLTREPPYIHAMYGSTPQARQILIARRLAERGVRFVQLWHGAWQPWDNHDNLEAQHRKLAGECSQAIGALLADLKQRGLLDSTLVIIGGEFGRTPTVETRGGVNPKQGRDHNHYGFSLCLAGGGVKGGYVHGATDDFGFRAVQDPVHVHDLHATLLSLLGFDHERLTYRYAGRDFRLTDVHGRVIDELIA